MNKTLTFEIYLEEIQSDINMEKAGKEFRKKMNQE